MKQQIIVILLALAIFLLVMFGVAKLCRADTGVWLPAPNGLMQWFSWIQAEPNEPNWPKLSDEVYLGFKFWLRPRATLDTMARFVFVPDDPNHRPYAWESADIIRVNRYSTRLEAGTLWWETVPAESWWNLTWIASLNKNGNWKLP